MASLTVVPTIETETAETFGVLQTPFGSGVIQRHEVSPFRLRQFRLSWPLLTKTEKDQLVTLYRNVRGAVGKFSFTPPDEVTAVNVHFVDGTLRWQKRGAVYSARATVEEVL